MINDLTIIIVKNTKEQLFDMIGAIPNHINIIVADLNENNDLVDYSCLPDNIMVISKGLSKPTLINEIILNHVYTNNIIVIDDNYNLNFNTIKILCNRKRENPHSIIIHENLMIFTLSEYNKVKCFNENTMYYKEFFAKQHYNLGTSINGNFTNITDDKLKNIKVDNFNEENFTIIIPSNLSEDNFLALQSELTDKDELIVFKSGNTTLAKKLLENIKNAKNENIIILNTYAKYLNNIITKFKLHFSKKQLLISHTKKKKTHVRGIVNDIKPTENSSISFSKQIFKDFPLDRNLLLEDIIRKIIESSNRTCKSISYTKINEDLRTKQIKLKKKNKTNTKYTPLIVTNKKPKILILTDVKGWAWDYKSKQLKKYLSDEFQIDVHSVLEDGKNLPLDYDLYMSYGYSYIDCMHRIPKRKRISGITAHRNWNNVSRKMKNVYAAHANSVMLLKELNEFHDNTFYVPNGVDEKMFYLKKEIPKTRDNLIVGHVGKLSPLKGQKEFIEPACKKAGVEYRPHYNNYMNAIPHNKMPDFYQEVDIVIIASTEDGTPNSGLEASACGRMVLSNKIGNMPELITNHENGILVDKNIDSYVEALLYLKNNRDHMIEMGQKAREEILKSWTWKIQAEKYKDMFNKLIDRN